MELNDIFEELKQNFSMLQNKITAQERLVRSLEQEKKTLERQVRMAETEKGEAIRKLSKLKALVGEGMKE